jgi:hypothetical protein
MRRVERLILAAKESKGSDCGVGHFRVAGPDPDPEPEH